MVSSEALPVFGDAIIVSGKGGALAAFGATALATCLALLLVFGNYSRKERVPGYVAPSAGLVRVVAPRDGVVTRVEVAEGEEVAALQPLLSVSTMRSTAQGADLYAAQAAALREERASVRSRMASERDLAEMERRDARRRIGEHRRQAASARAQRHDATARADLLQRDLDRLETLRHSGYAAPSLLDARLGELLEARQDIAALDREIERLDAAVAGLESELASIPARLALRLDELRAQRLAVERALSEAEAQREITIRAPVAGRVTTLVAHAGLAVSPERALLAILPEDSTMQAELLVPTHAAGFIRPGQEVRLRYDAFPHQKFGMYRGTVRSVSRTVLNPEDQGGPVRLQAPAYRVVASLDAQAVTAYGEAVPLQPGLTLQADVVRERLRLIEWLFDPVRAAVQGL